MEAKTEIHCNGCQYLKIIKRQIKIGPIVDRNTLMLFCTAMNDYHIGTIEVKNSDLNSAGMPYIKAPFICHKRQELRKQNKEQHFERSIT